MRTLKTFRTSLVVGGILSALLTNAASAEQTSCDYIGDYDEACIKELASNRDGGLLLIWSAEQKHSCAELQDTAMLATHEYCSELAGEARISSTTTRGGAVPYTCDGVSGSDYVADRETVFVDLIDDGEGYTSSSGLNPIPEGASVAYWKFLCVKP